MPPLAISYTLKDEGHAQLDRAMDLIKTLLEDGHRATLDAKWDHAVGPYRQVDQCAKVRTFVRALDPDTVKALNKLAVNHEAQLEFRPAGDWIEAVFQLRKVEQFLDKPQRK